MLKRMSVEGVGSTLRLSEAIFGAMTPCREYTRPLIDKNGVNEDVRNPQCGGKLQSSLSYRRY